MLSLEPITFGDDRLTVTLATSAGRLTLQLAAPAWQRPRPAVPLVALDICDTCMPRVTRHEILELVACDHVPNGVHLSLVEREREIGIGLWLRVVAGELRVLLPPAEVREEYGSLFRLFMVDLLPGLVHTGTGGQLLLPINTGLLVHPQGLPALCDRFLLYGEQERWELLPQLPVCAAGDQHGGLLCLATQGAADMRVEAATHGDDTGHVSFTPVLRDNWSDPVDLGQRELLFAPLAAGQDLLHHAARRLRRHVQEDLGKPTLSQRAAESPALAYQLRAGINKLFFGIQRQGMMVGGRKKAPIGEPLFNRVMTFAQAEAGLARLHAAGVEHLVTESVGWNFRGHDGLYPTRFPIDERLGGEAGFRALLAAGRAHGYRMSVHDNFLDLYLDSPDLDPDWLVRDLAGEVRITGFWGGGLKGSAWAPAMGDDVIRRHLRALQELGVEGPIYLDALGAPLMRNYHPRHRGARGAFARSQARFLELGREIFGSAATEQGYLFAALPADIVCSGGSEFQTKRFLPAWPLAAMRGTRVPLWSLALHGLVIGEGAGTTWPDAMRSLLFGLIPRFEWSAEPGIMPVLDDAMAARYAAGYDLCVRRYGHLVPQELTSWSAPSQQVERTTFADGTEIVADFARHTLLVNGQPVIPAAAFPAVT